MNLKDPSYLQAAHQFLSDESILALAEIMQKACRNGDERSPDREKLKSLLATAFVSQLKTMANDLIRPELKERRKQVVAVHVAAAKLAEMFRDYLPDIKEDEFTANYYSSNPRRRRKYAAAAFAAQLEVIEDLRDTTRFILDNPPFSSRKQQPGSRNDPSIKEERRQSGSYSALRFVKSMAAIWQELAETVPTYRKVEITPFQQFTDAAFGEFRAFYYNDLIFGDANSKPLGPIRRAPALRDHIEVLSRDKEQKGSA